MVAFPPCAPQVKEVESIDYSAACCVSNCNSNTSFRVDRNPCLVNIFVKETMKAPVYMYYKMTEYYQNHRYTQLGSSSFHSNPRDVYPSVL